MSFKRFSLNKIKERMNINLNINEFFLKKSINLKRSKKNYFKKKDQSLLGLASQAKPACLTHFVRALYVFVAGANDMSPVLIFKTKYLDDHRLYCQVSSYCGAWKNRVDCCIIGNMINSFMASKYHLKTRNQPEIKNPFKIKSVFLCNFKVKKTPNVSSPR